MFLPGDSLIHRLDSRVKLLSLLITVISILWVDSWIGYVIMAGLIAVAVYLSGISLRTALEPGWQAALVFRCNPVDEHLLLQPGEGLGFVVDLDAISFRLDDIPRLKNLTRFKCWFTVFEYKTFFD